MLLITLSPIITQFPFFYRQNGEKFKLNLATLVACLVEPRFVRLACWVRPTRVVSPGPPGWSDDHF